MTKKNSQKKYGKKNEDYVDAYSYNKLLDSSIEEVESAIKDAKVEKTTANRYNKGKKRFSSAPWKGIAQIGLVASMGAEKYGDYNYKKGFSISELENSALRHLYGDYDEEGGVVHDGYFTGEDKDPESKLHHLAHVCWNLCVIMEQLQNPKKYGIFDDRYKEENQDEPK